MCSPRTAFPRARAPARERWGTSRSRRARRSMDSRLDRLQRLAAARPGVIALAGALPARELIPKAELARALGEVADERDDALQYGWPEGIAQLRAWIAERLRARGA